MTAKPEMTEIEKILFCVDQTWLAKRQEEILEPDLPIIDPHHHLWDRGSRYLFDELLADIGSGHNVLSTVYLQCGSMYRAEGDYVMAPLGETEFVNGVAAMSASGLYGPARACAGIVGFANLKKGARIEALLEAHIKASSRFRGIRHSAAWDGDPTIKSSMAELPEGLLLDQQFREGFALLARYGLSFDAWIYHPQIPELADLARKFPDTPIVLDHVGAPLAIGVYAGKREDVFAAWRKNILELAACPNVNVKLGGMGMHLFGFDFEKNDMPPSSSDLANAWKPYVETCIEAFGPDRCMFESNFPVDKRSYSYPILWNAFKRLAKDYSDSEKTALFSGTARRIYRLDV
jgi:L-fuconolactonase